MNPVTMEGRIKVPPGLRDLLQEFTVSVLREQPKDLVQAAIEFFTMKKNTADNRPHKQVESDEEEDEEPMPPPPRNVGRRAGVAAESYDPEKDDENSNVKVVHPKTEAQRQRLTQATKDILLFRCLDDDQMKDVIDAMFERHVSPGEKVITLGEDGDNFYVIEKGVYDIIVKIQGEEKTVGKYENKGSFGELALMYNTPRAATILATTEGVLWAMTREVFRSIVLKKAFEKRRMYEELLNQVPILESLSAYERMSIADALKTRIYEDGALILKQGDPGDEMYFVEDGEVVIKMKRVGELEEKELTRIEKGGYFGELALLTSHPRAASAYAVGRIKLAVLDVGSFERLLGPCLSILQRNIDSYEQKLKTIFGSLDKVPELRS
ncbi:cAMP-dependent protein kinase type II-alpha regulatory subunit [Fasciolopsis buskii]|uniref:cAMP-dependent protein kinase type II regulatory subunit n=1 Tax=Fasciolopsis buskii TaxID=27845 RepID=A0A8E0VN48_9TREM|nr:cAMP-dependent protein kinase type II-alpha regulatory subunit [Fasciolopsis buski]